MRDLAYFKAGIRGFFGSEKGARFRIEIVNRTRKLAILGVGIRELFEIWKAGDKNLQRQSSCGIVNIRDVTQNRSYPCFCASHSTFVLRCCFILTLYGDI